MALFIDEAHDIHGQILTSLKRIVEVVVQGGCQLSIILAGHPKLGNSLSKSSIEEIGARTKVFDIDSAMGNMEKYVEWLFKQCLHDKVKDDDAKLYYLKATLECAWSRDVLSIQITSKSYERQVLAHKQERSRFDVEYSLRGIDKPVGVAGYDLTHNVPEKLKDSLPSPEELVEKILFELGLDENYSGK